jgi:hypothetical protein
MDRKAATDVLGAIVTGCHVAPNLAACPAWGHGSVNVNSVYV